MPRIVLMMAWVLACALAPADAGAWGHGGRPARSLGTRGQPALSRARVRLKWRIGRARVRARRRMRAGKLRFRSKVKDVKSTLGSLWKAGNGEDKAPEARRWGFFGRGSSLRSIAIPDGTVGDVSTAGMVASGVMETFAYGARFGPVVTALAAPVMGGYAINKFRKAKTLEGRVDASTLLAWSVQGASTFVKHLPSGKLAGTAMGVVGGLMQAGIGAYRVVTGLRGDKKHRARMIIGGIDLVAGLSWAAYSLDFFFPTSLAIFSAATVARIGYDVYLRRRKYKTERGRAKSQLDERIEEIREMEQPPEAVVIDPVSPFVAARLAEGPKVHEIEHAGKRAFSLPMKATTKDGQDHTIQVIVPVSE